MIQKSILLLSFALISIGAVYGFNSYGSDEAKPVCKCCGNNCTCVDCKCDELSCECGSGGKCECSEDCQDCCTAPCQCCGIDCSCIDCVCDKLGCTCNEAGPCFCSSECGCCAGGQSG